MIEKLFDKSEELDNNAKQYNSFLNIKSTK